MHSSPIWPKLYIISFTSLQLLQNNLICLWCRKHGVNQACKIVALVEPLDKEVSSSLYRTTTSHLGFHHFLIGPSPRIFLTCWSFPHVHWVARAFGSVSYAWLILCILTSVCVDLDQRHSSHMVLSIADVCCVTLFQSILVEPMNNYVVIFEAQFSVDRLSLPSKVLEGC